MPDRGYGPGGVLNPYALLWAVVIIGSLGLLGYAAMKIAGPRRGALLLGFIGGFMSSTAVTLNAAQAVRSRSDTATLFAAAVAAFLFLRVDRKVESSEIAIASPDQLATAFAFIAIVIVALLVGHYAQ